MKIAIRITKLIIVALVIVTSVSAIPSNTVFASVSKELSEEERESGFYTEGGLPFHEGRPAINPDFAPDESCNIAYELKCIPGIEQDCPEGFHNGEDDVCSPVECQEGYHSVDDDETGLCYPNSEDCDGYVVKDGVRYNFVFVEGEGDENDRCADPSYLCHDDSSHEICKEYLEDN